MCVVHYNLYCYYLPKWWSVNLFSFEKCKFLLRMSSKQQQQHFYIKHGEKKKIPQTHGLWWWWWWLPIGSPRRLRSWDFLFLELIVVVCVFLESLLLLLLLRLLPLYIKMVWKIKNKWRKKMIWCLLLIFFFIETYAFPIQPLLLIQLCLKENLLIQLCLKEIFGCLVVRWVVLLLSFDENDHSHGLMVLSPFFELNKKCVYCLNSSMGLWSFGVMSTYWLNLIISVSSEQ